jgi:hypothetical protein
VTAHTVEHGPSTVYKIGADGWTEDDERRLRGPRPHVMCKARFTARCEDDGADVEQAPVACKQLKVSRRHTDYALFCFGCGALQ